MMRTFRAKCIATLCLVAVAAAGTVWATSLSARSGTATLTGLTKLASDGGQGERWQVSVRDVSSGEVVAGPVRVIGVPIGRPEKLGKAEWSLSGTQLTGTVSVTNGPVMAWFSGTVTQQGVSGQFSTVTGQSGSWIWEGAIPTSVP